MSSPPPLSPTRLRQIALVSSNLERSKHLLTRVLDTEVLFTDPRVEIWGLENFLVAIGGDIIEVVAPTKPDTTAGRFLDKRGADGGYMLIMQTDDALTRRQYLTSNNLAKAIYTHYEHDSVCVQYHPKGIKGGVIPELDSHTPSQSNPHPVTDAFTPWHACGHRDSYPTYSAGMKRNSHLQLKEVVGRLAAGDGDVEGAARQWEELFGIERRKGGKLGFVNCEVRFVEGGKRKMPGIVSVRLGVAGLDGVRDVRERAEKEGVWRDDEGCAEMVGIRWFFEGKGNVSSKL